jgi:hypothetical protein
MNLKHLGYVLLVFIALTGAVLAKEAMEKAREEQKAKYAKVNVFAILSPNLEAYTMDVCKALKEQEGLEAFPMQGFQTHCTLYMTSYEVEKVEAVKTLLASLTVGVKQVPVKSVGLHATKDFWLFINLEKGRNLQTLSDLLVNALSPMRSPNQPIPGWLERYPEKKEFFQKYGSPNVFVQFDPHMTLLAKSDPEKVDRFIEKSRANATMSGEREGTIVAIGMAIADGAGQMKEIIASFPLQP